MTKETHAWRVRVRIHPNQVEKLSAAIFEVGGISETYPNMVIYFSMTNFAMFMVACSKLDKPTDITKIDMQIVDMKKEPEIIHSRFGQPRPIEKLRFQENKK